MYLIALFFVVCGYIPYTIIVNIPLADNFRREKFWCIAVILVIGWFLFGKFVGHVHAIEHTHNDTKWWFLICRMTIKMPNFNYPLYSVFLIIEVLYILQVAKFWATINFKKSKILF